MRMKQTLWSSLALLVWIAGRAAADATGPASADRHVTDSDALQTWLASHAIAVRSIDPSDNDFADLAPLGRAIGSARVVQLGEPSHGAGSAFSAKSRLIRFLHERLGFDVLIWESGLYDVAVAQAGMRSTDDGVTAAGRGIFTLWTAASEVTPLFDYIKASQATLRPIEMAGFDLQVTADGTTARYEQDLREFVGTLRDPALRAQCLSLTETALGARERLFRTHFANPDDLTELTDATQGLRDRMKTRAPDFEAVHSELESAFIAHTLENMRADAALRFESAHSPATTPERESTRDALNATNLRWLIENKYAGRKVLVWAHNVHVMNAYYAPGFHEVHLEARAGDMTPSGTFLRNWWGDQVYTIGMTTFQGKEGFATGGPTHEIAPAPSTSVEGRLHASGLRYAFVDFRSSRQDRQNPLHTSRAIRIPKFETNTLADGDRVFDGIFLLTRCPPQHPGPNSEPPIQWGDELDGRTG